MRSRVRDAARATLGAAAVTALVLLPAQAASASHQLKVDVSVPSVAAANATKLWVANTGTGSVLEFNVSNGREVRDIKGAKYSLYNPDAMLVAGSDVWVADESSNTVTVLRVKNGDLVELLRGGPYYFGEPRALAAAEGNVFVLGRGGDALVVIDEKTAKVRAIARGRGGHLADAVALAAVGGNVWALSTGHGGFLTEFSGHSGKVLRVVTAEAANLDHPTAIASTPSQVWVSNGSAAHLSVLSGSTGRLLGSPTVSGLDLDQVSSLVLSQGRIWLTADSPKGWIACVLEGSDRIVRRYSTTFRYPAAFWGPGAVYVTDRLQSRVTVFAPRRGTIVRVLVN